MQNTPAPHQRERFRFLPRVVRIGLILLATFSALANELTPRAAVIKPVRMKIGPAACTNVIMVKFRDGLKIRARDGKLHFDEPTLLPLKQRALKKLEQGRWERVDKLPEEQIEAMRQKAQRKLSRAIADLNTEFYFFLPDGVDAGTVIDSLNALDAVELAQPVPRPPTAPLPPNFQGDQYYLTQAPSGIDALAVWNNYGTKGGGIRVADLEYVFNASHHDLPTISVLGPTPVDPGYGKDHATAVLGELFSLPNGWGTTGIVPEAAPYFVGTYYGGAWNIGGAISTALGTLQAGDVILIEQQYPGPNYTNSSSDVGLIPVEWYKVV